MKRRSLIMCDMLSDVKLLQWPTKIWSILADIRLAHSHYRAYLINRFAFLKDTNTGSELLETKRPNERVPSQIIKVGWPNASEFAVGLTRTTASDSN